MTEAGPARKRRRGGVAQRIEQAEEEAKIASQTVELLLQRFASGAFSAKECALIAEAVVKDIKAAAAGFNVLHDLSQLDKEAKDSTHASRTMNRILDTRSVLPEPFVVNMTFTDGQHNTAMLLPHEYFAAYWKHPERRATSLLPDELELPRFWSAVREHPCLQNHPIWARSDALQKCIPLCLHGDEVPVAGIGKIWCRSVLCFSWFSLMSQAGGVDMASSMQYIWGVFEKFATVDSTGTMDTFWSIMRWSFAALWAGQWPSHDHRGIRFAAGTREASLAGSPLADGYYCLLFQLCGDLDYNSKWLSMPRWSAADKMCCLCKAQLNGVLSWRDNRLTSAWQSHSHTTSSWKDAVSTNCKIFALPGVTSLNIALDYMRCMFLGWLQFVYGSVLHVLVHTAMPDDQLTNLRNIQSFIKEHQSANNIPHRYRQPLKKLTMFQPKKGYPKLRGRAADIKGLHSTMVSMWRTFGQNHNVADRQFQQILAMLELNDEIAVTLDTFSPTHGHFVVPQPQATRCFQAGLAMSQLQSQLLTHYSSLNMKLFNQTSKIHFVLHALKLSQHLHPYLVWCFKGEMSMRRNQKVWKSCLTMQSHHVSSCKAANKYRYLLQTAT